MRVPSNSPVTLPFGSTAAPYNAASPHMGTDFAYEPDEGIYAPFTGRVNLVPNNGRDGNGLYMTDPAGRFHGMLHTSKYLVSDGAQVMEGQEVAIMGDTGYAFGVHLHWCVKENGDFIDPLTLVKGDIDMAIAQDRQVRLLLFAVLGLDGLGIGEQRLNALDYTDPEVTKIVQSYIDRQVPTEQLLDEFWESAQGKAYRDLEIPQVYSIASTVPDGTAAVKVQQIKQIVEA
jgi:hypothetical protein